MKKLLLLTTILLLSVYHLHAQDKFIFCEIVGNAKLNKEVVVEIDFGQKKSILNEKSATFTSMIDAMDYMGNKGWEFVQAYMVISNQQGCVYRWILKKNVSELTPKEQEDVFNGLILNR